MIKKSFTEGLTSKWIESYHVDSQEKGSTQTYNCRQLKRKSKNLERWINSLFSPKERPATCEGPLQHHWSKKDVSSTRCPSTLSIHLSVFKDSLPLYVFLCSCSPRYPLHMELCLLERQTLKNLFASVFFF